MSALRGSSFWLGVLAVVPIPIALAIATLIVLGLFPAIAQQQQPSERSQLMLMQAEAQHLRMTALTLIERVGQAQERISELEKLCGDPCKPKAEPAK
jgi:hypothetical protein